MRSLVSEQGVDFGQYWNWTVVDNRDGSHSVGARYVANGREHYSTCIIRHKGEQFVLEKLSRLR